MQLFKPTYKDLIRKYDKSIKIGGVDKEKKPLHYDNYVFSFSDLLHDIDKITTDDIYKQYKDALFEYDLDIFTKDEEKLRTEDVYNGLLGEGGWLSLLQHEIVDCNYLTGYWLSKTYINNVGNDQIMLLMGCDDILNGINAGIKGYTSNIIKHNVGTVINLNVLNKIRSDIDTNINKLLSHVITNTDYSNKSVINIMSNFIISITTLKKQGISICKLPDIDTWNSYKSLPDMIMLYCSYFEYVYVFKTPWCVKPSYYLISSTLKYSVRSSFNIVLTLLKCFDKDKHIVDRDVMERGLIWTDLYKKIMMYDDNISNSSANKLWIEGVMT